MSRIDGLLVLAFAAIFCALLVANVFGTTANSSRRILLTRQNSQDEQPDCTTELASDLYGLGVRLGIYFQWFSGWVANNFIVDEMAGALDGNAIFLFALLVSIVHSTQTNALTQIDGMIILQLCSGTIWSVLSLWGYRTIVYKKEGIDGIRRFGGFGTHLRLLLIVAAGSYGIWYWRVGTEGLPKGLDDYGDVSSTCPRSGIIVLGVPIKGSARTAGIALSCIAIVYGGLMVLVSPLAAITRIMKMASFMRSKSYAETTKLRYVTGADKQQLILASRILGIVNFVYIGLIMGVIEVTLNENYQIKVLGIKQSNNGYILMPAQLLPMLIGAFSFLRMLWISFELWRDPEDISPSLGRHASHHNAKVKKGRFNVFGLFSTRLEDHESGEEGQGLRIQTDTPAADGDIWDDKHEDPYTSLQRRLSVTERIIITWLPWISLLYFWPWQKEDSLPPARQDYHHLEPRREPVALQTPHKTRFSDRLDEDDEGNDVDTSYHRPSRVSAIEQYDPHKPQETI